MLQPLNLGRLIFKQTNVVCPIIASTQIRLTTRSKAYSTKAISMSYNEYATTEAESGAPPVIIMHGLLGSKNNWRGISKALTTKFKPNRKIYAVDARNHGESPHSTEHSYEALSNDLVKFLQEHDIPKAVMMGHSMGGRAMMYFALKYPNLVERAIILDISPIDLPRDFVQMKNLFSALNSAQVAQGTPLPKARSAVEEHLRRVLKDPTTSYDFILQNLKKSEDGTISWGPNIKLLLEKLSTIGSFPEDLIKTSQYHGPTLFIGGNQSNFINPNDWPAIQNIFPNSNLVWLECGHLVHFEQPQQFLEHVTKFINL